MQPTQPETQPTAQAPNHAFRVAAWAVLGLGLVGVGLGGYSSYEVSVVNSNLDPWRRYPCSVGGALTCSADGKTDLGALTSLQQNYVNDQQSTGDGYVKLQWIGYGLGGALILTSAVFFYHGYFAVPSATTAAHKRGDLIVMPSFGPGSAGATAYLRF